MGHFTYFTYFKRSPEVIVNQRFMELLEGQWAAHISPHISSLTGPDSSFSPLLDSPKSVHIFYFLKITYCFPPYLVYQFFHSGYLCGILFVCLFLLLLSFYHLISIYLCSGKRSLHKFCAVLELVSKS